MAFSLNVQVERRTIKDREPVVIELSFPPSTNNLFANAGHGGRIKSEKYQSWETASGWQIVAKRPPRVPGPVTITLEYEDKAGRRDLDNLIKPVLDLLVKFGVIDGDHRGVVREINARWSLSVAQGVRVTIRQYADPAKAAA